VERQRRRRVEPVFSRKTRRTDWPHVHRRRTDIAITVGFHPHDPAKTASSIGRRLRTPTVRRARGSWASATAARARATRATVFTSVRFAAAHEDLRDAARRVLELVVRAGSRQNKVDVLLELRETLEVVAICSAAARTHTRSHKLASFEHAASTPCPASAGIRGDCTTSSCSRRSPRSVNGIDHAEGSVRTTQTRPVRREVAAIEGEDPRDAETLGRHDERGVSEVHRPVGMARHEFEGARETGVIEKPASEAGAVDELRERSSRPLARSKEMERFGEYRNRRPKRRAQRLQRLATRVVIAVSSIEERDEGPGVDQDHPRRRRRT